MANTVYSGADTELRLGIRADKDTAPTAWHLLEFDQITVNPEVEKVDKPRLGAARHNALDSLPPREGTKRVAWSSTIDADTVMFPRWLRAGLGAPSTSGAGPYTHLWNSGGKGEVYFDMALRQGAEDVVWVKQCALGVIGLNWDPEKSQDYPIQLSGFAVDHSDDESDWPTGTTTAAPTPGPILRASVLFDTVAADQLSGGSVSWDRNLERDFYAATGAGHRLASYIRPGKKPAHSGGATLRAEGSAFLTLAKNGTLFAADTRLLGVTTAHSIRFNHGQANMQPIPIDIGVGVTERALSWTAHADSDSPALELRVVNAVSSYA